MLNTLIDDYQNIDDLMTKRKFELNEDNLAKINKKCWTEIKTVWELRTMDSDKFSKYNILLNHKQI